MTASPVVAELDEAVYNDPTLLHEATAPVDPAVGWSLTGGVLTLDWPDGFADTFRVTVTVTDPLGEFVTRTFLILL